MRKRGEREFKSKLCDMEGDTPMGKCKQERDFRSAAGTRMGVGAGCGGGRFKQVVREDHTEGWLTKDPKEVRK